ncbi:MAG: redox-regulated ATPase YchF [Deltaproteobacteria bacterium]|nr:redox-regulated ATPase YchF [Deltaproteobacteria bacterium]
MGFNSGIVGLPNVGKSTIYNAMTAMSAASSNYPFCTIEPNVGMVPLMDKRLYKLAELIMPEKITPTAVEFVDIAGLVKGASKGCGLGNQFLGHIRGVDMIAHVVRCFESPDIVHVEGSVDPIRDIDIIEIELMLADLESVEKKMERLKKNNGEKSAQEAFAVCEAVKKALERSESLAMLSEEIKETKSFKGLGLITAKPVIYVANVSEQDLVAGRSTADRVRDIAYARGRGFALLCGKIEAEVSELAEEDRARFLHGLGLTESGLEKLSIMAYTLLDLITFFTAGKKEVRAWTIEKGKRAPEAAGRIHSDFERGFIRAEVISYDDFIKYGSEAACKEKGLMRLEGKDYIVADGDIIHFRFAV